MASSMNPILSISPFSSACSAVKIWPVASLSKAAGSFRNLGRPCLMASLNCVKPSLTSSWKILRSSSVILRVMLPIVFQRMAGDGVLLDAPFFHQIGDVVMGNDHADRAGPGGRLGEDALGLVAHAHRHVVAAAGRDPAHADDHGNMGFLGQLAEVVEHVVAAGDRAAGRIDADHKRLQIAVLDVFPGMVDLLFEEPFAAEDRAFDREDGHFFACRSGSWEKNFSCTRPSPSSAPSPVSPTTANSSTFRASEPSSPSSRKTNNSRTKHPRFPRRRGGIGSGTTWG